jgi:hypothetical protein
MTPLVGGIQVWMQTHGFLMNELRGLMAADASVWCEVQELLLHATCIG